jgi:Domain of unknown function (DUF4168)
MMRSFPRLAAGMTAMMLLSVPAWGAGSPSRSAPATGDSHPSGGSMTISDTKLDATAHAIEHVQSVKEDYQQRLDAAPASDKPRIAEEAEAALEKAVSDQGLTVAEYNAIINEADRDPEIREKLIERLQPPSAK